MSELIVQHKQNNIRLGLLVSTSAIALAACIAFVPQASAADHPVIWLEGGWHFDSVTDSKDILEPPFDDLTTNGYDSVPTVPKFLGQGSGGFPSFMDMQKPLGSSNGAEGRISFQPKGSDWIFSIAGRYGRSKTQKQFNLRDDVYGQTVYTGTSFLGFKKKIPHATIYAVQANSSTEAHTILDFQVGRDIGIGLLGSRTDSVLSFGARYAQMNISSKGHSYALPGVRFYGHSGINYAGKYFYNTSFNHQKSATTIQRFTNFHGMGPSLSWSNTTGLLGKPEDEQLALDWGANAAVLFGRQRVKVNYTTATHVFHGPVVYASGGKAFNRTQSRRITVPNLGGFAALSYRFTNAKMSAGYRADFFFGALDRGLDTRRAVTTGYHGPFATISIGLGG